MGSILSSTISGSFGMAEAAMQADSANAINQAQLEDAQKTREFNAEEAEKQRGFQHDERLESQDYQHDEWDYQFNAQNEEYWKRLQDERAYNTPAAQAARLRQAGINSSVLAFGNSTGSDSTFGVPQSSSVSSPTPSGGSAATGSPVSSLHMPNLSAIGNIATGIGSLMKSISESKLADTQKERISSLLEGEIESQMLSNNGKKLLNEWQKVANIIQDSTKDTSIKKAFQELLNMKAENYLLGTQSEYYGNQADLAYEEKFFTMAKKRLTDQQYNLLVVQYKNAQMLYNAQIGMMNARTEDLHQHATMQRYRNSLEKISSDFYSNPANSVKQYNAMLDALKARAISANNKKLSSKIDSLYLTKSEEFYRSHPGRVAFNLSLQETERLLRSIVPITDALPRLGGYGRVTDYSSESYDETTWP